ncbi:MAG: MoaD/ThiS family protein [Candidatus Woesearchaeota archaeon]
MDIFIERPKRQMKINFKGVVSDLLKEIDVNPEEVIVSRNGSLVTLDEELENEDKIEILSVVSGG